MSCRVGEERETYQWWVGVRAEVFSAERIGCGPGAGSRVGMRGGMRIVAAGAAQAGGFAFAEVPIAAGAAVRAVLPVEVGRAVAGAAEGRDIVELQLPAVAHLKRDEILLIVAVVAEVVAVVGAVAHDDIGVLLGDDDLPFGVVADGWRLVLLVAAVAIVVGHVFLGLDHVRVSPTPRRGLEELGIYEGNILWRRHMPPWVLREQRRERDEADRQATEEEIGAGQLAAGIGIGALVHGGGGAVAGWRVTS